MTSWMYICRPNAAAFFPVASWAAIPLFPSQRCLWCSPACSLKANMCHFFVGIHFLCLCVFIWSHWVWFFEFVFLFHLIRSTEVLVSNWHFHFYCGLIWLIIFVMAFSLFFLWTPVSVCPKVNPSAWLNLLSHSTLQKIVLALAQGIWPLSALHADWKGKGG